MKKRKRRKVKPGKRSIPRPAIPATTATTASAAQSNLMPTGEAQVHKRAKPRPVGRTRRATASPAQRRGADLTRYLRIHLKHPYADRGIRAIHKLALEVAHLANLELNSTEAVAEN